jgi:cytochrome c-type biogenesis protein CcmH/NrfG
MRIKENAEIRVANLTRRRLHGVASFYVKQGGVLVDIETSFRGSQFKILTPTAEAKALGTKFVVDVEDERSEKTWVGVLEGSVEVKSAYEPPRYAMAKRSVVVQAGEKTEVAPDAVPRTPQRLMEREWQRMQELYRIGRKPQVALLVSTGIYRVRELLRPCPLYISDEEPRTIPPLLEEALNAINEALQNKDREKHREAIATLEKIVEEYPDPRYNPQFLLFIAAYYNYLGMYQEAIDVLEEVLRGYPESSLASLAQCAIGVIYEEGMHDTQKATEAYQKVLRDYPHSPETWMAKKELGSEGGLK